MEEPSNWSLTCHSPFKTAKEGEYVAFFWEAFQTNYTHGKYQFAFLAYPDDADQIREVLIHGHNLSQRDLNVCAAFDWQVHEELEMHINCSDIGSLHTSLRTQYPEPESIA